MIRRQCPQCGASWYSAAGGPWKCEKCGTMLNDRHNKPLMEGRNENVGGIKVHWRKP
jgi:tRNA(Ile2) C34 agmatinyltransferase TiaS